MTSTPFHDERTTVAALRRLVDHFVTERRWHRYHNPKNLVMSLGIETGELMEHFQWLTLDEAAAIKADGDAKRAAAEEVADCLAYILAIANAMEIDLASTLDAKMIRNAEKYPVAEDGETPPGRN